MKLAAGGRRDPCGGGMGVLAMLIGLSMNYEKKLIDFSMLSDQEKEWLKEFEVL